MVLEFVFLVFLLGASIGSFINAWSFRYGTPRSILSPSACDACGRKLAWYELLPLASFLFLRGKCRTCRAPLSFQYPLVELITGAVFVLIFYKTAPEFPLVVTEWLFWSLIIAVSVYDARTTILPDGGVFAAALIAFVLHPQHFLAGIILAAPFAAFWLVSRGRWMGFGDAKLQWGLGMFLGLPLGLMGLFFGVWLAALVGIVLMLVRRAHFKTELPFGPFLALGAFLAWFFSFDMMILWNGAFLS